MDLSKSLLFCILLLGYSSGTWMVQYTQAGSCSGTLVQFTATQSGSCSASPCSCSNGACISVACNPNVPPIPNGMLGYTMYSSPQGCAGAAISAVLASAPGCNQNSNSASFYASCNGNNLIEMSYPSSTICAGTPSVSNNIPNSCGGTGFFHVSNCPVVITTIPSTTTTPSASGPSSSSCFHKSSVISYKGAPFTMAELHDHESECRIPHIVQADGVAIDISCAIHEKRRLRLTSDHLVYALSSSSSMKSRLLPASDVRVGDVLFADLEEKKKCRVIKVVPETNQTYFGLNCVESIVLANGIKTSTFGKYHAIPALWMKCASKVLGIERASSIGDSLASTLKKMNLI